MYVVETKGELIMDYQFRPFGIGVVMTSEEVGKAKEKGKQLVADVKKATADALFIGIGLGWLVAEAATRHATNGVQAVATGLADVHEVVAKKQHEHGYFPNSTMPGVASKDVFDMAQEELA
jgi:hypothetical protein